MLRQPTRTEIREAVENVLPRGHVLTKLAIPKPMANVIRQLLGVHRLPVLVAAKDPKTKREVHAAL